MKYHGRLKFSLKYVLQIYMQLIVLFSVKFIFIMNAIITGATKGIGKAIAQKLALAGYNLAMCSRSQAELEIFKKELLDLNPIITIAALQTDCAEPGQVKAFI